MAIAVAPVVARYCYSSGCDANAAANAIARLGDRLYNPDSDPDELSAEGSLALGAPEGGFLYVTDFTGTFELRKLQWRISRAPAGRNEDVDVCTWHFLKVSAGTPAAWVDGTDLPVLEGLYNTYWTALKVKFPSFMHEDQFRWYKDGPAYYTLNGDGTAYVPTGDNPAVRVTEVDVAGTSGATTGMPPQCAVTVTEKTSSRRHWGRFYFPFQLGTDLDATGLLSSTPLNAFLASTVTLYNGARAASMLPVVFSIQKPVRPKAGGGTLPAVGATAYEITSLQMDDIVDIIRSRRYKAGVNKPNTVLT